MNISGYPTIELQTSQGSLNFPLADFPSHDKEAENVLGYCYKFISNIIKEKKPQSIFKQYLQEKPAQLNCNSELKPLFHHHLSIFMLFDLINQCDNFQRFKEARPLIFQIIERHVINSEESFQKMKLIIDFIIDRILYGTTEKSVSSLATLAAFQLLARLKIHIPDGRYNRIYLDAVRPETSDVVQNFRNTVLKEKPKALNAIAKEVGKELIEGETTNMVANYGKWMTLIESRILPEEGFNSLVYGAAFAGHTQKVA